MTESMPGEITDQDKLMAALSYPIGFIVSLIILLTEGKNRPFQKYHAVQSLIFDIVLWVVIIVLSCVITPLLGAVTLGVGAFCGFCPFLLWFITLYYAYLAYQGQYFTIPVITDFMKSQKWV
ncbi:MAG: DUF4870 domain-containing protein [Chloroflexota bacterium]